MRITKYMLETYKATVAEIKALEIHLDELRQDERDWRQMDTVKGSCAEFPYLPTIFKVSGFSADDCESVTEIRKLQKQTEAKIIQKKLTLERQKAEVECWLDSVADPNIRCIIRLYYIAGLSWEDVCRFLGEEGDGSTQRKQANKFWKNQK